MPGSCPTTDAIPKIPPNRPWIRERRSIVKMSAIAANTLENSTPPNRPCTPRNATSWTMSWDWPQRADARTKPVIPASINGLRPNRSPSLPAIGVMIDEVTRYAVRTQA
jgi:hypothetical protein